MRRPARAGAISRAAAWTIIRLRWPIVIGWTAAAIAAVVFLPSLAEAGDETSLIGLVPEDAAAIEAGIRSAQIFSVPVITHTAVVQRNENGLSRAALRRVFRRAKRVNDAHDPELKDIRGALPIVNARGLVPGSRETRTTAITYLFFDPNESDLDDQEELAKRYAEKYVRFPDDALIGVTGAVPARIEEWRQIAKGLPWVTLATLLAIAVILGVHFRSPVAPAMTLLAAGAAYVVSLRTVGLLGQELDVTIPRDAEPVLIVLLLGVVTDYAVFFLHGMRERLRAGETRLGAAENATAEYLPIVVTAGLIVAGGTAALVAGQLGFFRAFGPGMALTVLMSLFVAVTLVPAVMGILGSRLFFPSNLDAHPAPRERPSRLGRFTTARPVALVIALVALACLAFAGRGLLETNLGLTQIHGLPTDTETREAALAASRGFAPGILSPTVLLLEGVERTDLPGLIRLERALDDQPGVASSIGPANDAARAVPGLVFAAREGAARYMLILDHDPQGGPAIDAVAALREQLPSLLADAGLEDVQYRLAGDTPLADETVTTIKHDLVRIGIAAFLVNLILLMIFLRAVVAPLYLVVASGLALAASIGVTTLVFQGFLRHDELTYHVPFAVAVLLLSLGSDYNVFLVGRIRQAAQDMPLRDAIATAAPRASAAIGIAGLALAVSFAALALIDLRQFHEFGVAMFVGVMLDAFLIRAVLIPALMALVGERSWWPWGPPRRAEPAVESAGA